MEPDCAQDNRTDTEDQLWMIHGDRKLFLNHKWQSWNTFSSLWRIHVRADVYRAQILTRASFISACARQEFAPKLSIGYIQPVRRLDAHICSNRHGSRLLLCTQWTEKTREDELGIHKYQLEQMRLCCFVFFVLHLSLVVALPSVSRHFIIFTMLFHFFLLLRVRLWVKGRGQFFLLDHDTCSIATSLGLNHSHSVVQCFIKPGIRKSSQ